MATPTTGEFAGFVSQLKFEQIPSDVVHHIKSCVIDSLGCGVFGSAAPWSALTRQMVVDWGGKPESTVWGTSIKAPPAHAALANSIAVNAREIDDTHLGGRIHPGCLVVASALPVAEREGKSGKDLLTSIVAGYETLIRANLSIGPSHFERVGRYMPSLGGIIGSAVGCGKLLGLSQEQMQSAIHIAAAQAAGLFSRTMVKRFCNARAAEGGVVSAYLAKSGFSGMNNAFEADYGGFCVAFSDNPNLSEITRDLGKTYEVLNVGFKPYGGGWPLFTSIEAVRQIKSKHELDPENIKNVQIKTSSWTKEVGGRFYERYDTSTAMHSIPFVAAVTLLEGNCFVDQFTEEIYRNPRLVELARKVNVSANPEFDNEDKMWAADLEVQLKDGERYNAFVQWSKGSHKNPLSEQEIENKFEYLASRILSGEKIKKIVSLVRNLEKEKSVNSLTQSLSL